MAAYMGYVTQAAVASENSHVQILNVAASTTTVRVLGFYLKTAVTAGLTVTDYATDLGSEDVTLAEISRKTTATANNADLNHGSNVGALGNVIAGFEGTDPQVPTIFPHPVYLAAGEGLTIANDTVNEALSVTFIWEETGD